MLLNTSNTHDAVRLRKSFVLCLCLLDSGLQPCGSRMLYLLG